MDTFFGLYFHYCLELALETWAKASSVTHSLWVHELRHTHSLASFQWSGLSGLQTLRLTENCQQIWKWCPYGGRGVVLCPFVLIRWEMAQPVPTKAVLQAAKAAAMCTACLKYARPPPPYWIAPTDNRWPKSDRGQNASSKDWSPSTWISKNWQCGMWVS